MVCDTNEADDAEFEIVVDLTGYVTAVDSTLDTVLSGANSEYGSSSGPVWKGGNTMVRTSPVALPWGSGPGVVGKGGNTKVKTPPVALP